MSSQMQPVSGNVPQLFGTQDVDVFEISQGSAKARLDPHGALLKSWAVDGRELLFSSSIPTHRLRATHPIGPICGRAFDPVTRVIDDIVTLEGLQVKLPLHGGLREANWERIGGDKEGSAALALDYEAGKLDNTQYPYGSRWNQVVSLDGNKLTWSLSFTSLAQGVIAPADMGCHLYLPHSEGLKIHGLDGLPYKNLTVWDAPAEGTIRGPGAFSDNVNRDWQIRLKPETGDPVRAVEIEYPREKYGIKMRLLSPRADNMIVWSNPTLATQIGGPFICPEFWLAERNSITNGTAAKVGSNQTETLAFEMEYLPKK
ncbi:MAG: hypothetical protein V1875_09960 [Candidatus Altiarchaeota archaeon]